MERLLLRLGQSADHMDRALPIWARRSNPVVRRQLGIYWKTLPLDLVFWLKVLGAESALVLLAVPFPIFYSLVMPVVTVSVLLMPLVYVLYAQVLYGVMFESVSTMLQEKQNNTLALLMVTPLPFSHILFSKIAAAVWRQIDNLSMVVAGHVFLSLPLLVLQYSSIVGPRENDLPLAVVIVLALLAYFFRLFVEPVMLAALGLLFGAVVSPRILALIVAAGVSAFYFAFVNLARMLSLPIEGQLLMDLALPLFLPLGITWAALAAAGHALRRD